jgi:hypothetical protein
MLKILNNSLNGIALGQRKVDLDDATLNESSCSLEFDRKHKIQSDSQVITVSSSETCDEFSLNGKIINFSNLEKFVEEENPLVEISGEENYFYTFPQYNLALYVDYKGKLFLQVLIYDESIKDLYENRGLRYLDFQKSKLKSLITFYGKLIFIPHASVGNFEFNSSLSDIIKEYDILEKIIPDKKNILWINNFALRFDNEKLTQITIFYDKKEIIPIYYDEINISSEKGLSELLNKYDGIERGKFKYLFKELGLVVAKDFSEFHFFEQSLLKFWANLHRPITSW